MSEQAIEEPFLPFVFSPLKSPSRSLYDLSPIDFGCLSPFSVPSPLPQLNPEVFALEVPPFKDILATFERTMPETNGETAQNKTEIRVKPKSFPRTSGMRPFVSFEMTELTVSHLRSLLNSR
jgi:hypothetical protein